LKATTVVGIVLIAIGILGFVFGGVSFTHKKKDVDMGPIQVTHKETRSYPISPVVSTVVLVAGVGLVIVGARSK